MANTPDTRRNLMTNQPYTTNMPEGNGWPEPLVDDSDQLRIQVLDGKNGERIMDDGLKTSQQKEMGHHAPEGDPLPTPTQPPYTDGQRAAGLQTTGFVSDPGGNQSIPVPSEQYITDGDLSGGARDPLKTSQQLRMEHKSPEGL